MSYNGNVKELGRFPSVFFGPGIAISDLAFRPGKSGLEGRIKIGDKRFSRWMQVRLTMGFGNGDTTEEQEARTSFSLLITGIPNPYGRGLLYPPRLSLRPTMEEPSAILVGLLTNYTPDHTFQILEWGEYCYFLRCEVISPTNGNTGEALIVAVASDAKPLKVLMPDGTYTVITFHSGKKGLSEKEADEFIVAARNGAFAPTPTAAPDIHLGVVVATAEPEKVAVEPVTQAVAEPAATVQPVVAEPAPTPQPVVAEVQALPIGEKVDPPEAKTSKPRRRRKPTSPASTEDDGESHHDNSKGRGGNRCQQEEAAVSTSLAEAVPVPA